MDGLVFGGTALLVASPWYLKNWLWTGNPLYPLLFGSLGWPAMRVELWTDYMRSFGVGESLLDYLLLPVHLYTQHGRFSTFMGSIEILSFLFPLALFYPWTRRSPVLTGLAVITSLRFGFWAVGSQQTRFLLPLFPALSLLAVHVLLDLSRRQALRHTGRVLATGLVAGMVIVTLVYSLLYWTAIGPEKVFAGLEPRQAFLRRSVHDYGALQYTQTQLSDTARVLMLWDGRGYRCDQRFLPDVDHSQWTVLVANNQDTLSAAKKLAEMGVTHLYLGLEDADFILQHDPGGQHQHAFDFYQNEFAPRCTRELYHDSWGILSELTCLQ